MEQRLGNQDSANRHFAEYKLILFGPTCCDDEQEHLRADDEAPAGLQDADEEAGAGSDHHYFSFHRPCLETHKRFSWLLLSFENRDNVLPEAFMTSRKFIIVLVLTILRKEVVGLGGL